MARPHLPSVAHLRRTGRGGTRPVPSLLTLYPSGCLLSGSWLPGTSRPTGTLHLPGPGGWATARAGTGRSGLCGLRRGAGLEAYTGQVLRAGVWGAQVQGVFEVMRKLCTQCLKDSLPWG